MVNIRPRDWKTWKYWLHLGILSIIVQGLLQLFFGGQMFTWQNILYGIPILGVADITAHTLLGFD